MHCSDGEVLISQVVNQEGTALECTVIVSSLYSESYLTFWLSYFQNVLRETLLPCHLYLYSAYIYVTVTEFESQFQN